MQRTLGDLTVSALGLGGMPMSIAGRPSEEQSIRTIHAAIEAGVTLIDTADVYCLDDSDIGHNERLIAKALAGRSERVVVATKGGLERPNGDWPTNGHPAHLRKACEKSLVALGVHQIEVYQLHAPDDEVPFADTVGELARLRAEGKVRHVGLSNVSVEEIRAALAIVPIVSVQNRCSPFDLRVFQDGVLRACEERGITFLAYSPVNGGRGKVRVANDETLKAVGSRHGVSPFQAALAWLLAKSPVMLPIPGASKERNATDSAGAMTLRLSTEDIAAIDRAVGF